MTREEIVARAMALSDGLDWDDLPEENTVYEDRCDYRRMARAAIAAYESALRDEGYVIIKTSGPLTTAPNPVALTVAGRTIPLNEYEAIAPAVERCKTGGGAS